MKDCSDKVQIQKPEESKNQSLNGPNSQKESPKESAIELKV